MKLQILAICLFLAASALAQDITGRTETIENETRPGTPLEIIAGDASSGNAIGNKLIVINSTIQGNNSPLANASIMGGKTTTGAANENSVEVSDTSTVNRNIYGGYGNTQANHNTVLITGSKVNQGASLHEEATLSAYQAERELVAGEEGYVSHSVSVDSAQVAGNLTPEESLYSVYGGVVHNGEAAYNRIIVRNSKEDGNNRPIGNNLIGAYGPYLSDTYLHENTVEVINSQVSGLIVGGAGMGFTWEDKVRQPLRNDNNSVILTDSEVNDVIGAYGGINTNGNSIRLSGSSADNLYGVSFGQNIFYSSGNDVIDNTANNNVVVLENNSSVSGNIYGAQSHSVQASGNQINITDSNAYGNIYGVHMSNTLVQQDANTTGWNTTSATAQGNSILLQNAEAGNSSAEIAGAMNFSGAANNNAVQIAASTVTASTLAGGWAEHERQTLTAEGQQEFAIGFQADGNGVTASNSMMTANIYGGQVTLEEEINPAGDTDTTLSSASSNYVELYDSSVTGNVYGGAARGNYTRANGNRVWLSSTNIEGNVYGGLAEGADSISSNNEVILHNTTVNGNVYGASAAQGGGNTVTLSGQTTVSGTVYGGTGTGNQLTLLNFQSSDALSLSGFDNPYLIVGADTSVTFAQDVPEAHVIVQGIADVQGHVLARTPDANSSFILHAENSGVYTYSLVPQAEADSGLTAWLLSGGFSQQRAESYAQTNLVALALANAGDGLLDSVIQDAAQTDQEKGSFLKTGYEHLKHETGSGFTLRATTALAGLYGRRDTWTGGLYTRYAYGTYTTYPVRADSYASSWAGGAFGAWDATENLQLLADARIGWQQTSYGGSAETGASFEYEGAFTSMLAGALYTLGGSWTAGAKLRWTHIRGDSMTDNLGESVYITGSDSLLGTLGLSYAAQNLAFGHFMPLARAELLHEFNGRGVSRVEGRRLNALSLRGTSGRLTLGLTYTDETKGLSAALAGFAQGGQEDGWGLKFNGSLRF